jgi:hypothetical protein
MMTLPEGSANRGTEPLAHTLNSAIHKMIFTILFDFMGIFLPLFRMISDFMNGYFLAHPGMAAHGYALQTLHFHLSTKRHNKPCRGPYAQ